MNAARRKGRTDLIEKVQLHLFSALPFVLPLSCKHNSLFLVMGMSRRTQAESVLLATLEFGWDKEFGGFFYFLDIGTYLVDDTILLDARAREGDTQAGAVPPSADGKPPQQLEWDQKLWWVHGESLVALALAYQMTRKDVYAEWYKKVRASGLPPYWLPQSHTFLNSLFVIVVIVFVFIVVTKVFDYTWKRFPDPQNGEWFGYLNRRGTPPLAWCDKWSHTHPHIVVGGGGCRRGAAAAEGRQVEGLLPRTPHALPLCQDLPAAPRRTATVRARSERGHTIPPAKISRDPMSVVFFSSKQEENRHFSWRKANKKKKKPASSSSRLGRGVRWFSHCFTPEISACSPPGIL